MPNLVASGLAARRAAERAREHFAVRPTTLVGYRSEGRLLVIGPAARMDALLGLLPPALTAHVLLNDACPPPLAERLQAVGIRWLERAGEVAISGYLGEYRVLPQGWDDEGIPALGHATPGFFPHPSHSTFDLVLDLQENPAIRLPVPPIGYCAPGVREGALRAGLEKLAELIGEFDKPKFFEHQADSCAHGASRIEGCRQCLDVCAAGAISSRAFKIEVNPYLCQGCGDCSTVCPAGAMNYLYPRRGDTLNRLRLMLDAYYDAGGQTPVLLFHDSTDGEAWMAEHGEELPEWLLPYPLEALAAAGMEVWLSALAYGCAEVMLFAAGELTEQTARSLKEQMGYAGELLESLGYRASLIRLSGPKDLLEIGSRPEISARARARFAGADDKRTVIRLAVEHLYQAAPIRPEAAALSTGAPFGEIRVDRERCTLCLSCVSICPERALADGGDLPKLKFVEANCVQCGLCQKACPENAVELAPRYLFDQSEARRSRLLHEEEVFRCVECSKPFATASMIKTITGRLQGHPLFQGGNLRRLQMCEDCRVKVMFSDRRRNP